MGVAAYNLLRGVIAQVAQKVDLKPREVSFKGAASFIRAIGVEMTLTESAAEAKKLLDELTLIFTQIKLHPRKKKRIEPRLVVRDKRQFPRMRDSRENERKRIINGST